MNKLGGMMLAGVATAVLAASSSCFDGTGAAAWLDDDAGDGTGTGTGEGTGTGTGEGTGTGTGEGTGTGAGEGTGTGTGEGTGTVADWMKTFSGDKTGDELSHQEWLAKKGFADPNALVSSYRSAEKAIREGGKVKIPGDGASEAEIAAYREAIGVPKEVAGYEITMPEGAEQFELDTAILDPLREAALKHNVPAAAFKGLADVFLAAAVEDAKAEVTRTDAEAADQIKEWGANANQKKEEFRRAAQFLGLNKSDVADIQREFGGGKTLALFAKIGALMGEDFFASGNNPSQRFGVPSLEAAQKAVDAFVNDSDKSAKLNAGDKATIDAYNRAVEALAAWRESDAKKRK